MQTLLKRNIFTSYKQVIRANSLESPKPWSEIPGPRTLPILGGSLNFMPGGKFYKLDGQKLFEEMYNIYGPIVKLEIFGNRRNLFLYDAESASQILRGEAQTPLRVQFETYEYFRKEIKRDRSYMSIGLVSNDLEDWQKFRSTVNPVYLQPKIMKLYNTALDEIAMDIIERLKSLRDENHMIKGEIQNELQLYALECIGVIALGRRLNCFDPNLPKDSPEQQLISITRELFATLYELEYRPQGSLWKIYPTPLYKKAMKYFEQHDTLAKYFIDAAVEEIGNKQRTDEEKGILEKLLEINTEVAYAMARDSLFAGVDATSISALGILYLLAVNPEKQNKLREEQRSSPQQKPYLKACIKEGLRLMPSGIGNFRTTSKEHNVLGYTVPAKVGVTFVHQIMSKMDHYFARPTEFIPERWLVGESDQYRNTHPYSFLPFGFGIRSCLGRRIAELEIESLISRLVENFEIGWIGPPPKVEHRLFNQMVGKLNFTFKDAK